MQIVFFLETDVLIRIILIFIFLCHQHILPWQIEQHVRRLILWPVDNDSLRALDKQKLRNLSHTTYHPNPTLLCLTTWLLDRSTNSIY